MKDCEARKVVRVNNWWMGLFKGEGQVQRAAIGGDEWHCPNISVAIAFERGRNTVDQEVE
jgi:hypothetical protein